MNEMKLGEIIGLALLATNIIWTIYWSIRVHNQLKAAKSDERIAENTTRILKLEVALDRIPDRIASHDDVSHVHNRISSLGKEVNGLGKQLSEAVGTMQSINKNLDLLNKSEFLHRERAKS